MKIRLLPEALIIPTVSQFSGSLIVLLLMASCPADILADAELFITLDVPGSAGTMARSLNPSGQVAGTYTQAGMTHGFLYSGGAYAAIDVPGATATYPSGIDGTGRIAGFYLDGDGGTHGFLYAAGSYAAIDVPGAAATRALGLNDGGQIVGTFADSGGEHGFLETEGTLTILDVPGAASTTATGINSAGEIAGIYTDANSRVHGFLYSGGNFSRLDAPGEGAPPTLGINDASEVVGFPGFLYRGGTFASSDAGRAPRETHAAIDNAGNIAGWYTDANGAEHGFIATLPVESSVASGRTTAASREGVAGSAAASGLSVTPKVSVSGGACDINSDGTVAVADVQAITNQALGVASAANDLNGDRVVNVADVQIVINAALGLGCAVTASTGTAAVRHLSVQQGNGQVACVCQSATLQAFQPISVKATDVNGQPVSGATVNWTVTSGNGYIALNGATSVTDSSGIASQSMRLTYLGNFSSPLLPYLASSIQASSNNISLTFNETQSLITSQGSSVILANPPQFGGQSLGGANFSGNAGSTLSTPIQTMIGGTGIASNGVPNVSVRIVNNQVSPTVTCVSGGNNADPGSVLSDAQGNTSCFPIFSGSGSGSFYMEIGGVPASNGNPALYLEEEGPINFTSLPGAPVAFQIVSGNNQVSPIGPALSLLVARLVDAKGNVVPGQTVTWSVVPAGAAALSNSPSVTDTSGQVSILASLGLLASAGARITVTLIGNPSVSATFTETIPNALTALTKTGGDNQTAAKGTNFANPLVVQLVTASGAASNFPVRYTVSGPVNLGSTIVDTDANGVASITVMAGSSSGTATVTVTAAALTQTFTLTVQ